MLDRLRSSLFYPLPHHALSRIVHRVTRIRTRWWKRLAIGAFRRLFDVNLAEAQIDDPDQFDHFNDFFTRALKPGMRPLAPSGNAWLSPVDGTISQAGEVQNDRLFQAKGHDFDLTRLLGGDADRAAAFIHGHFATIYLSPKDYHRVHMPAPGTLVAMTHIPGRLFSVAPFTVRSVANLFARNERVACHFQHPEGWPFAVILVGAIFVSSIETVWAGEVTPPRARKVTHLDYENGPTLATGDEMGRFNMGSTVIFLTPPDVLKPRFPEAEEPVRLGQLLGTW